MTGGAIVGGIPLEDTIKQLQEKAEANPEDIDSRNDLARIAIQQRDMSAAMRWMDEARALDPEHPRVRTHLAILQVSIGMVDRAKIELEAALKADPTMSEALLWKGIIALQSGDRTAAIPILETALEHADTKEERVMATSALSEARKPPATVQIKGQIGLEEGTTKPTDGVLFVMVRRTAEAAGPPVAALRLSPQGVPGTFSVTDRDMMPSKW